MLHIHRQFLEGFSIIKRDRFKKINALAGRSAIAIAKEKNPSLYNKYKRFKDLHMEYKEKIDNMYGKRAMSASRQKIRS